MDRKNAIHALLSVMAYEVFQFIKESESSSEGGWVRSADIKNALELDFLAVPKNNKQYGEKGWLFAILARKLEDDGLVEYKKEGSRAFYRSKRFYK